MLPSRQYPDFLTSCEAGALLRWALDNRARFKPAKLTGGVLDPERRRALKLEDLGPHRELLEQRLLDRLPDIFRDTGTPPFQPDLLELELAGHGDGAFFTTHSDIPIGLKRGADPHPALKDHDRLVSGVYYLHNKPRAFSGGALRLYGVGDRKGQGKYRDYEPEHNSLVAFPSWAFHEVREVSCPGDRFEDWRFAVNIWICRKPGY
jgi:Rps23 Pro-64 3,4-dihydroxylase Tpa1-like proline 4-hydroxylase